MPTRTFGGQCCSEIQNIRKRHFSKFRKFWGLYYIGGAIFETLNTGRKT